MNCLTLLSCHIKCALFSCCFHFSSCQCPQPIYYYLRRLLGHWAFRLIFVIFFILYTLLSVTAHTWFIHHLSKWSVHSSSAQVVTNRIHVTVDCHSAMTKITKMSKNVGFSRHINSYLVRVTIALSWKLVEQWPIPMYVDHQCNINGTFLFRMPCGSWTNEMNTFHLKTWTNLRKSSAKHFLHPPTHYTLCVSRAYNLPPNRHLKADKME